MIVYIVLYYSGMLLSIIEYSVNTFSLLKKYISTMETKIENNFKILPSYILVFLWVLGLGK